jgi:hypothetical protein
MVDMETDLYLDDMNVAREANIILYIATIVGQSSEISDDSLENLLVLLLGCNINYHPTAPFLVR